jgi:hypothetical protein
MTLPKRAWEDMQIIYAVFAGLVIREGFGKQCGTQHVVVSASIKKVHYASVNVLLN